MKPFRFTKEHKRDSDNTSEVVFFDDSPDYSEKEKLTGKITGDPFNESAILIALQHKIGDTPGVLPAARSLSHFGEHALGWITIGGIGFLFDNKRRSAWFWATTSAVVAHAISVVAKRIVRRPRPHHAGINIGVATPSKLSFPSSHATSTAAAVVAFSWVTGKNSIQLLLPVMMVSRMVVGVHYPTDVLAGAGVGYATARAFKNKITAAS